jgi:hypothetical protein
MQSRIRLISGRVPVANVDQVTQDRYEYLDLASAEPNLGKANNNGYLLIYDTVSPGQRKWVNSIGSETQPFESVVANTLIGSIDGGTFI